MTDQRHLSEKETTLVLDVPFNLQSVIDGCMGNMAVVGAVLSEFERQLVEDSERIGAKLKAQDAESARSTAHKLKGAAGIFSAEEIWSIASEIERRVQDGEWDVIETLGSRLRAEVSRCLEYMPTAKAALVEMAKDRAVSQRREMKSFGGTKCGY